MISSRYHGRQGWGFIYGYASAKKRYAEYRDQHDLDPSLEILNAGPYFYDGIDLDSSFPPSNPNAAYYEINPSYEAGITQTENTYDIADAYARAARLDSLANWRSTWAPLVALNQRTYAMVVLGADQTLRESDAESDRIRSEAYADACFTHDTTDASSLASAVQTFAINTITPWSTFADAKYDALSDLTLADATSDKTESYSFAAAAKTEALELAAAEYDHDYGAVDIETEVWLAEQMLQVNLEREQADVLRTWGGAFGSDPTTTSARFTATTNGEQPPPASPPPPPADITRRHAPGNPKTPDVIKTSEPSKIGMDMKSGDLNPKSGSYHWQDDPIHHDINWTVEAYGVDGNLNYTMGNWVEVTVHTPGKSEGADRCAK